MARRMRTHRFQDLVDAATRVFIDQGYRRTQMADVATAMGVAKGTVYLYVESKDALFDLAVRYADVPRPVAPPVGLPVRTPPPGRTLRYVKERLAESRALAPVHAALKRRQVRDARAELEGIVRMLYDAMSRSRTGLKLIDRCAADYPELARLWFGQGREAAVAALGRYLEARIRSGHVRPVPDVAVAARMIIETIVFWAVHRHWDPAPHRVDAQASEDTVVQVLCAAFLAGPRARRRGERP